MSTIVKKIITPELFRKVVYNKTARFNVFKFHVQNEDGNPTYEVWDVFSAGEDILMYHDVRDIGDKQWGYDELTSTNPTVILNFLNRMVKESKTNKLTCVSVVGVDNSFKLEGKRTTSPARKSIARKPAVRKPTRK